MNFYTSEESELSQRFLRDGYVIVPTESPAALDEIRDRTARATQEYLGRSDDMSAGDRLNGIHIGLSYADLNDLRLSVFRSLNAKTDFRPLYFSLARNTLAMLVGNELAMQRRVNLSVQLPNDDSSLLPVHADVLNGDSPFEVVQWTPLVDVYGTKTMYILPPETNRTVMENLQDYSDNKALFDAVADQLVWLDIPYGNVLIFNQNLFHGNVENTERETRWSMNCRFKSVFTPYADKKLGEFFEPITLRPASRMGMDFRLPDGFGGGNH